MNQCIAFKVRGQVQGVYYRAYTQEKAKALGITGFARNEVDGSVTVIAFGPKEALLAFEEWLWEGSPSSDVTAVSKSPSTQGPFEGFSVL